MLSITTDTALTYVVAFPSGRLLEAGTLDDAGSAEVILPTGRTDYQLTVSHEGTAWSYDLRVDCPPQPPTDPAPDERSLEEIITQSGIDLTRAVIVTAVPLRTQSP